MGTSSSLELAQATSSLDDTFLPALGLRCPPQVSGPSIHPLTASLGTSPDFLGLTPPQCPPLRPSLQAGSFPLALQRPLLTVISPLLATLGPQTWAPALFL